MLSCTSKIGLLVVLFALAADAAEPSAKIATLRVESSAFRSGEKIPEKYSAYGQGISPPLNWSEVPPSTKSLVILLEDPDAVRKPYVHWVLYKLPPDTRSLSENLPTDRRLAKPEGALQGKNSGGNIGYFGPKPPAGAAHHYHFKLYALDNSPQLDAGVERDAVLAAMKGHIVAEGEIMGTYQHD
jgi:Raf kinase inhibitor-like YbhB/YbcL family protein